MAARRYTEAELQNLTHHELVQLVLGLQTQQESPQEAKQPKKRSSEEVAQSEPTKSAVRGSALHHPLPTGVNADDDDTEEWTILDAPKGASNGGEGGGSVEAQQKLEDPPVESGDALESKPKRLERAISKVPANIAAASKLRKELAQAVQGGSMPSSAGKGEDALQRLTHANFFLPDLASESPEFRKYILEKLTSPAYQKMLEEDGVLNWAIDKDLGAEHKLYALWALSDGNCLLHAALLAIWGLHDTHEVGDSGLGCMRAAMSRMFTHPSLKTQLRRRWALQIERDNAWQPASQTSRVEDSQARRQIEVSESQMDREWTEMSEIAGRPKMFLDSVHILALAHTLRRPFIVMANSMQNDPFGVPLTPIFFRGIYLPLEFEPSSCCRQPLVLCFQDSHFMPLVPLRAADGASAVQIPLADGKGEELPLRFATPEELDRKWQVVQQYMDVELGVNLPMKRVTCNIAFLHRGCSHQLVVDMVEEFVHRGRQTFEGEQSELDAKLQKQKAAAIEAVRQRQEQEDRRIALQLSMGVGEEADEWVTAQFDARLPIGARPGDTNVYSLPAGCTEPKKVEFVVPEGSYGGSKVVLTARFKIKGKCIKDLRDVTGVSRERAVSLLRTSLGDPNAAAQQFFSSVPSP